jgi:hypothetical protein
MAIELSLFNNSVTTLVDHLTSYYGEEATLETYVICARVKSPDIPGGSGLNWIVGPNGHERAGGHPDAVAPLPEQIILRTLDNLSLEPVRRLEFEIEKRFLGTESMRDLGGDEHKITRVQVYRLAFRLKGGRPSNDEVEVLTILVAVIWGSDPILVVHDAGEQVVGLR